MAEAAAEAVEENEESNEETTSTEEVTELTPVELKASDRGWRPETDWEGETDEWVDARTYVQHGELMDKISAQSSSLKKQGKAIKEFKVLQMGLEKRAVEKAKKELLLEKQEAYEASNFEAVVAIEERIKTADKELQRTEVSPEEESAKEFAEYFNEVWKPANKWYADNDVMKIYSDKIGVEYYNSNSASSPEDVFNFVDKQMKEKFPNEYSNGNRKRSAGVAGSGSASQTSRSSSSNKLVSNLNKEERRAGQRFVDVGLFKDLTEYAESLKELTE